MISLKQIQEELSSYPPLMIREWKTIENSESETSFNVMQFNILADGLSGLRPDKGGFTCSPPECLEWSFRSKRLLEEIWKCNPDILAVQELDHYEDFMNEHMKLAGYDSLFQPKPDSACKEFGPYNDGCAIFYRRNRFKLIKSNLLRYTTLKDGEVVEQTQGAVILKLEDLLTQESLIVSTTHLKATKNEIGESIRKEQISMLLSHLEKDWDGKNVSLILLGDLNATYNEETYPPLAYPTILEHSMELKSAYALITGHEPLYTSWKKRPGKETKHTLDYIFYRSSKLRVCKLLEIPSEDKIEECRLPSFQYPSDHFSLVAKFSYC